MDQSGFLTPLSFGGMVHHSESNEKTKPCHSPLKIGDQVVLEVDARSDPVSSRFFVNGKAGQNEISVSYSRLKIGFSLAGLGTSIRIDVLTELDNPLVNVTDLIDISKTKPNLTTLSSPTRMKVPARDHPDYQPFFEKLKSGKSKIIMEIEMKEKGLNHEVLFDPDMLV
ncbi:hypothetical protein BLNAU_8261 [Blattamonas nauphoetae]|uniref:Uncharacterized protein n=1 Tax=Blattamonas nauphoetae TaxID=2049346 RepID=A0ABQ9XZ73_9EUKA|nr:hypothetical protein BLNAU_8261 [Blattamonas nauphoetae]